jgi:sulfur carrier protein
MLVIVNGKTRVLPELRTLEELLWLISPAVPFAVSRNEEVIPRGTFEECVISTGDRIDIVHPAAGG